MRYLILSDLHANLEAFRAVLSDARPRGFDRVLCLGDIVGYGGNPNEVLDLLREQNPLAVIRGNHDKVACGIEEGEHFNDIARAAAVWTRESLTPGNRKYLMELPQGPVDAGGFLISHGNPGDEDGYLLSEVDAMLAFEAVPFSLAFFGHTHFACAFSLNGDGIQLDMLGEDQMLSLDPAERYLVNPGSIGQPRDHNPRAAYALYDRDASTITVHRVRYDIVAAQKRITDSGLPFPLAYRLEFGV